MSLKLLPVEDLAACCSPGLTSPVDREEAEVIASQIKALADPVRIQLVAIIRTAGEACGCDLYGAVGVSQPTVSHHLKILTEAGILLREKRGTWAWFSVDTSRMSAIAAIRVG